MVFKEKNKTEQHKTPQAISYKGSLLLLEYIQFADQIFVLDTKAISKHQVSQHGKKSTPRILPLSEVFVIATEVTQESFLMNIINYQLDETIKRIFWDLGLVSL